MTSIPNYTDYYQMNEDAYICNEMDKFADDISNDYKLKIKSKNKKIKTSLKYLFTDAFNVEYKLWQIARELFQFGNYYMKLTYAPGIGIIKVSKIPVYDVKIDINDIQKMYITSDSIYQNHEIANFSLTTDANFLPYGKSMLEPAVKIWKQLQLMEDAILIQKLIYGKSRNKKDMNITKSDDTAFLREKLSIAINADKSPSSDTEKSRRERKLDSMRKSILSELTQIGMLHLHTQGFKQNDIVDFKLNLIKGEKK